LGRGVTRRNWATSSLTRRASSSLYSSAARLVYFFFTSESFSNDAPPCRVKKSVAEALPPTFIVRNCATCQLSRLVDLGKKWSDAAECTFGSTKEAYRTNEICTPMLRCTLEQSRHIYKPNVTLAHVGLRAWQSKHI
jgi:hypothetical protein